MAPPSPEELPPSLPASPDAPDEDDDDELVDPDELEEELAPLDEDDELLDEDDVLSLEQAYTPPVTAKNPLNPISAFFIRETSERIASSCRPRAAIARNMIPCDIV